jgi:CubicO group peptidase (beta-lactamase class C family)
MRFSRRLAGLAGGGSFILLSLTGTVAAQALDKAHLKTFNDYAVQTFDRSGVPGMALAIVQDDREVLALTLGVQEKGTRRIITRTTAFQLASVSKTFASALVAAMVADGVVAWDDPISRHLQDFRLKDDAATLSLSLRDGLAQRSGLYHHAGDELEAFGYGRDEILRRLRYLEPEGQFRTTFAYQNYVLTAASVAASQAAGRPFEDLIDERLFRPLGMRTASARLADFEARPDRATLHPLNGNGGTEPGPNAPTDPAAPAAGISASLEDMIAWVRFQLASGKLDGRSIVAADALAETHLPQTIISPTALPGPMAFYGLGWFVLRYPDVTVVFHDGIFEEGVNTIVTLIPDRGIGLVVLTNSYPVGLASALSEKLIAMVRGVSVDEDPFDALHAQIAATIAGSMTTPPPPPPANAAPPGPAEQYVGVYQNPYFGKVAVTGDATGLRMRLGVSPETRPLRPQDGDTMVDTVADRFIIFTQGPGQQAAALTRKPRFAQEHDAVFVRSN